MSHRPDYLTPRDPEQVERMSLQERNFYAQVQDLRAHAEKRFWRLELDVNTGWYRVLDPVGRELHRPVPLASLRGFFQSQAPQA